MLRSDRCQSQARPPRAAKRSLIHGLPCSRALLGALLCLACAATGPATAQPAAAPADGSRAFGFGLYRQLAATPGNVCFSPFSLSTALAMTYAGARGETEAQMARVLHFGENDEAFHESFGALARMLRSSGEAPEDPRLVVANALWARWDHAFLDWYLDLVTGRYGALLRAVDFSRDPAGARRTINDWVAEQTSGKIDELIGPGLITPLTRLVLTNAIYFHAAWRHPFGEHSSDAPFLLAGGGSVDVPMMHLTERLNYLEGESSAGLPFQVLELPYRGTPVSMLILLPAQELSLGEFEATLTTELIDRWIAGLEPVLVSTFLPRFTLRAALDLAGTLSTMGMPDAFHPQTANFSGMTGERELFISSVVHDAVLEVTEKGTEAAAATAVVMALTASPADPRARRVVFRADHPFVFVIRDRESGVVLFLGRLMDPRG
jgi:serpin B